MPIDIDPGMLIPLKLVRDQPLQQQLYEQLRDLIVTARLASGTRMPSTRMLADQFSVSRITVLLTYERLIAEGLLGTVPAKGTFVGHFQPVQRTLRAAETAVDTSRLPVGRPDPRLFPAGRWRALVRDSLDLYSASLTVDHREDDPALRRGIAGWLSTSRGLAVDSDQIILARSRQAALHTAAHMVLYPGARVVVESPCDKRLEDLLASTGATVTRVPVDDAGLQSDLLPPGSIAMALVTPEHQRPFGMVMSEARRQALLHWAERSGAVVLADDVDGELRYEGMDARPLMGLDRSGRVIHLGGFAVSLGPGVQQAYLVVPRGLVARARATSQLIDDRGSRLEMIALANFLQSGAYARHLHQVRKTYLGRRDTLIEAMRRHFGAATSISGQGGGLHLVWQVPRGLGHASAVAEQARQYGLDAASCGERALLIGFGAVDEGQLSDGVYRLADAFAATGDQAALAGE